MVSGDNQTLILLISKEKDETLSENEEVSENESENANERSSDGEDQSSAVSVKSMLCFLCDIYFFHGKFPVSFKRKFLMVKTIWFLKPNFCNQPFDANFMNLNFVFTDGCFDKDVIIH